MQMTDYAPFHVDSVPAKFDDVLSRIAAARASAGDYLTVERLRQAEEQIVSARDLYLSSLTAFRKAIEEKQAATNESLAASIATIEQSNAARAAAAASATETMKTPSSSEAVPPMETPTAKRQDQSPPVAPKTATVAAEFSEWAMASNSSDGSAVDAAPQFPWDAVARTLPPRRAVWWSCVSMVYAVHQYGVKLPDVDARNLDAAAHWSTDPGLKAVQKFAPAEKGSIGHSLARAAEQADANPSASVDHAVAAVALLLSKFLPPEQRTSASAMIDQLARDIAQGRRLWPENRTAKSMDSWMADSAQ